ncbi:porin [Flavobacterium sp. TSSA_36]|uniref:porin n=1 Tax=Flavobacterium sp. TSSA_36 TaxID=3447669 RepID=UPI003F2C101B
MKHLPLLLLSGLFSTIVHGQNRPKPIQFQGYGELYYSYDFSEPQNHEKPNFIYNHKRHNELNLNLGLLKATYAQEKLRANAALMVGTYAQYNLAAEPNWAQLIYEANVGIKIAKQHNLWIDAGIMPSHIGFESAIGADCWTLTRSILAENSPYYETGIKIAYTTPSEKLNLSFLVVNGWQKIRKPDNIQNPSFGFQINYKPSKRWLLNYSNFIGSDKADSLKAVRTYHNFYAIFEPSQKWGIMAGVDLGSDRNPNSNYSILFAPIVMLRYKPREKYSLATRVEYYNDKNQLFIATNTLNGLQVFGCSTNFDLQVLDNVWWRFEIKKYLAKDNIFTAKNNNISATSALTIKW